MKNPFHPIIFLPENTPVLDLSNGEDPARKPGDWGIGKYNEKRLGLYTTELFQGTRNIHMGIDLAGPVGTPIHSFDEGLLLFAAYNSAAGDYGATLVTEHMFQGKKLFALWGHLSMSSLRGKEAGQKISRGELIAWIGDETENGGWDRPHLHFQLSWVNPGKCDMPGVVSDNDREQALSIYPDPRMVLGPIY
jgi:murein DD-endopeptidase MepM/ murein hydrolase activator NlpD